MTGLVATTTPAATAVDALALADAPTGMVWQGPGLALGALGEALRIDLPGGLGDAAGVAQAQAALSRIEVRDPLGRPGTGPVALAALPFDPAAPGALIVPRTLWGRDAHGSWVTVVGAPGDEPDPWPAITPVEAPDGFSLTTTVPHPAWRQLIADAVERIRAGALDKVVLARRVDVEANRPFPVTEVLGRLAALYPTCMLWAIEGFIGASPELLVSRRGDAVESHPLAGTVARSGDAAADAALVQGLQASVKDRWEHRLVIDVLEAALRPLCRDLVVPDTPDVVALRNVSHLATHVRGRLAPGADGRLPGVLELAAALHPTPAVGGTPTKEAVAHLQAVEGFERGRYAGPVGWLGASGDGDIALGIRSALVDGPRASLYAGVGVVADSDPDAELAETQLKLQALLAALVRP